MKDWGWLSGIFLHFVAGSILLTTSSTGMAATKPEISILLSSSGDLPYAETASGDLLASFNSAVLGQLLVTTEAFNLEGGIIESFEYDYRTKSYSLRLRRGTRFHNGREAKAEDLEFSLLRGFFSRNRSFYQVYLNNISGIDSVNAGTSFKSGLVSGVKIKDNYTVAVSLKSPNPSFLHSLTHPYFSLVPREALNADLLTWKTVPIGAGSYRVEPEGFKQGRVKLTLLNDELRAAGAPQIVEIWTSHEPNRVYDVVIADVEPLAPKGYSSFAAKLPASVRTIFYSNQNPLGMNQDFRLAVHGIVNRDAIAKGENSIRPTDQMLPTRFWGRTDSPYPVKRDAALLHAAKIPKDLMAKTWRIPVFSNSTLSKIQQHYADHLSRQLKEIGINVVFYPSDEKFPSKKSAEDSPFRLTGRVTDYVDPLIMFASFTSKSPYEWDRPFGANQVAFEKLYAEAANADTTEARYESVKKLSSFVAANAISTAIAEESIVYHYNPRRISNLGVQPSPLALNVANIRLKRSDAK